MTVGQSYCCKSSSESKQVVLPPGPFELHCWGHQTWSVPVSWHRELFIRKERGDKEFRGVSGRGLEARNGPEEVDLSSKLTHQIMSPIFQLPAHYPQIYFTYRVDIRPRRLIGHVVDCPEVRKQKFILSQWGLLITPPPHTSQLHGCININGRR